MAKKRTLAEAEQRIKDLEKQLDEGLGNIMEDVLSRLDDLRMHMETEINDAEEKVREFCKEGGISV